MSAGAPHGIINSGYRAIDSLSVEKGYRHWHTTLRSNDTALEAGLGFTCKMKTDVPFLGREATAKQKQEGIRKKIACFTIDDHVPLLGLEAIRRNGELVGFLRQGEYGFHIKKSIGYGYVKHPEGSKVTNKFLEEGEYTVERMGEVYPAQVHIKSPFDPGNKRVQGIYEEGLELNRERAN